MDWWIRILLYLSIFAGGFVLGVLALAVRNFFRRRM